MTRRAMTTTFSALAFSAALLSGANAAGAPFCVAQSGPNGEASYVGNCIYASYQQCIAATVGSRGDCVGNIDYKESMRAGSADRTVRGRR